MKCFFRQYFVSFKLGKEYTKSDEPYATYFLLYVGIAAQVQML
jgi:hypothetical protein